jgi:hypothetical protein
MAENQDSKRLELGYRFHLPESSRAPGGNRLDIALNETPTKEHFDPIKVNLNVKSNNDRIEHIKITHPWLFKQTYQAIAGLVEIIDWKGSKEEAFIFGGTLTIESQEASTNCILQSSAPILEISAAGPTLMKFIQEFEILLAERSAASLPDHHMYETHLCNADPFRLYLACLNDLIKKFDQVHHQEDHPIFEFRSFLHEEYKRLDEEGLIPILVPTLEQIL